MGVYLNSKSAYSLFRRDYASRYYVDKSDILKELVPLVVPDMDDIETPGFNQNWGSYGFLNFSE